MKTNTTAGFTLIEVLIALTIASVALITALKTFGASADVTAKTSDRFLASLSAENSIQEVWITPAILGQSESVFPCHQGQKILSCQRNIFSTPHPNFLRIEVAVSDQSKAVIAKRIAFYAKDF